MSHILGSAWRALPRIQMVDIAPEHSLGRQLQLAARVHQHPCLAHLWQKLLFAVARAACREANEHVPLACESDLGKAYPQCPFGLHLAIIVQLYA